MELVRRSYWRRVGFSAVTGVPVDGKYGSRKPREWASSTFKDCHRCQKVAGGIKGPGSHCALTPASWTLNAWNCRDVYFWAEVILFVAHC